MTDPAPSPRVIMTLKQYAQHRGVNLNAVTNAIRYGRLQKSLLPRRGNWRQIDQQLADQEWDALTLHSNARTNPSAHLNNPESNSTDAATEYRRSMIVQKVVDTQIKQLELEERQGRLVDARIVRAKQFEIARTVSTQMLGLVDRVCDELALETDPRKVRTLLLSEIREVLRRMSDALGSET